MSKLILGIMHLGGKTYAVNCGDDKPFYITEQTIDKVKKELQANKIVDVDANPDNPEFNLQLLSGSQG